MELNKANNKMSNTSVRRLSMLQLPMKVSRRRELLDKDEETIITLMPELKKARKEN